MNSIRALLIFCAALLCLLVGQLIFALGLPSLTRFDVLLGVALHVLGCGLGWRSFRAEGRFRPDAVPPRWVQLMAIVGVGALAGVLRFVWLDMLPFRIDGDAAAFARAAADFLRPDPPPLIGTGWQSHTNVYFFLESLALRIFGRSAFGLRCFGALGGTLSVLVIFALGRSLWGFWIGLWAALITAVLPFHLVFSRVGTEVIHVTWLLPLVVWSIWQGWSTHNSRWLVLGGAATGLSQYFYPGARLIPILAVAQIGLLVLVPPQGARSWRRGFWSLLWLVVGVLAIYGPMIPYFIEHPEIYSARISIVSIVRSGWLQQQLTEYPWWRVLADQLRRSYLPFVFPLHGPAMWYVWPQYLGPFDAALFVLGLIGVWAGRQTPRWLKLFLAIYLIAGMFMAGVLTIDTPMPSRYVIFVPAIVLCIGHTMDRLARAMPEALPTPQQAISRGLVVIAISVYLSTSIVTYLRHDTQAIWNGDQTGQMATYAARYLQTLPEQDYEIFFLQTEWMYYEASPVLAFLTDKSGHNIKKELSCNVLTNVVRKPTTIFIAPQERIVELRRMSDRLQSPKLEVLTNPRGDEVVGLLHVRQADENTPLCSDPLTEHGEP